MPDFLSIPPLANERGIVHGFSTAKMGSMSVSRTADAQQVAEARRRFARALNLKPENITVAGAVHGAEVARVQRPLPLVKDVDGLVTNQPGIALFATFGDCLPILVFDPGHRAVGIAHAGWRGTEAGVAKSLVKAMRKEFGTYAPDLRVGIGPGICGDCYEVGPEFAGKFPAAVLKPGRDGKLLLDLVEANRLQLMEAGCDAKRIRALEFCTFESDRLFSHRRNPDGSRFAAIVALRG